MNPKAKPVHAALLAELERLGVREVQTELRSSHHALRFRWRGRRTTFRFSGSPSDKNAAKSAVRALRHRLGVRPPRRKGRGGGAKAPAVPGPLPDCPEITVLPDPLGDLAEKLRRS